jgi:hypothetical protein
LLSDGIHGIMIYDEACLDFGLHLFVDDGDKATENLERGLRGCHSSTRKKFIAGTFTGTVHFKAGAPSEHRIPIYRIEDLTKGLSRSKSFGGHSLAFQCKCLISSIFQ